MQTSASLGCRTHIEMPISRRTNVAEGEAFHPKLDPPLLLSQFDLPVVPIQGKMGRRPHSSRQHRHHSPPGRILLSFRRAPCPREER
jgi:hypothetical protein